MMTEEYSKIKIIETVLLEGFKPEYLLNTVLLIHRYYILLDIIVIETEEICYHKYAIAFLKSLIV